MSYPGGDLRDQLTHVGAEAVRAGLVAGSGGNLSARQPGSDQCWITAADTWLDGLQPVEFSLISIPDGTLRGGHPNPSSEWRLHTETYARRPWRRPPARPMPHCCSPAGTPGASPRCQRASWKPSAGTRSQYEEISV